jgi:hypothetical protein
MLDKRKGNPGLQDQALRYKSGTKPRSAAGARRVVTTGERIVRVVDTGPVAKKISSDLVAKKLGATPVRNSPKK